jgi:2-dehydro-3-deoxyphosphogalactonate aldolase
MISHTQLIASLNQAPLIAILRGVDPENVLSVADHLVAAGVKVIEVPLNSPNACTSIKSLRDHLSPEIIVGAGTVLTTDDVESIVLAGAEICISPNLDLSVVSMAREHGLIPIPGIATASEFFLAYKHQVRIMKLFPFLNLGVPFMQALQSVSPKDSSFIPVGGVDVDSMIELVQFGALAVGIGNSLYNPKISNQEFIERCSKVKEVLAQLS